MFYSRMSLSDYTYCFGGLFSDLRTSLREDAMMCLNERNSWYVFINFFWPWITFFFPTYSISQAWMVSNPLNTYHMLISTSNYTLKMLYSLSTWIYLWNSAKFFLPIAISLAISSHVFSILLEFPRKVMWYHKIIYYILFFLLFYDFSSFGWII